MRIVSFGVGIQSSTMVFKIAEGKIPMVDAAIFADTLHESRETYAYLDWAEKQLPFPVYRVSKGDLWKSATRVRVTKDGLRSYIATAIPAYTMDGTMEVEKAGIGMRACTTDFKIKPINAKVRQLLGRKRITKKDGVLVEMLIGISTDEYMRVRPNKEPWIKNSYPLLEMGMSRADCQAWFDSKGYPQPPRSACIFCPYRSDAQWLSLPPDEFAKALQMETELQAAYSKATALRAVPYLHQSRKLLGTVKFDKTKRRKMAAEQTNLFINDCLGMCGV